MAPRVDKVQKIKDQILDLEPSEQIRIAGWLEAVRDVRVEDARREAARKNKPAVQPETKKEDSAA